MEHIRLNGQIMESMEKIILLIKLSPEKEDILERYKQNLSQRLISLDSIPIAEEKYIISSLSVFFLSNRNFFGNLFIGLH